MYGPSVTVSDTELDRKSRNARMKLHTAERSHHIRTQYTVYSLLVTVSPYLTSPSLIMHHSLTPSPTSNVRNHVSMVPSRAREGNGLRPAQSLVPLTPVPFSARATLTVILLPACRRETLWATVAGHQRKSDEQLSLTHCSVGWSGHVCCVGHRRHSQSAGRTAASAGPPALDLYTSLVGLLLLLPRETLCSSGEYSSSATSFLQGSKVG